MKSLQGHLLIASPLLRDPNFFRSVVLLVQHGDEGALGLILNSPMNTPLSDVWGQVSESPCLVEDPLHRGGPCEGPLMVVHTQEELSQMQILPGLCFTTEKDAIESLVGSGDKQMKFFLGYAGWTAGQLEEELQENSWHIAPADINQIFAPDTELWQTLRQSLARKSLPPWIDAKFIPDDPSLN